MDELELINNTVCIKENEEYIDPQTNTCSLLSLFIKTTSSMNYTKRVLLLDSFNNAYVSKVVFTEYPDLFNTMLSAGHIVYHSTTSPVYYSLHTMYPNDLHCISLHKCDKLCRENVTDVDILQRLENEFYPTVVTGLK